MKDSFKYIKLVCLRYLNIPLIFNKLSIYRNSERSTGRHGDLERVFSIITQVDKSDNFVATKSEVKSRHTEAQASAPQ